MTTNDEIDSTAIYRSIFADCDAFVYRCHNDNVFTMQFMEGQIEAITGYRPEQIVGNRVVSFVGLTHPEDQDKVFAAVDAAIDAKAPWNVTYRLITAHGGHAWIRERGMAVLDAAGDVQFLQGLIVRADDEIELQLKISQMQMDTQASNNRILGISNDILGSIRTLSFLAVNARIEAARVGDAGRGFAVIAGDIAGLVNDNTKRMDDLGKILAEHKINTKKIA